MSNYTVLSIDKDSIQQLDRYIIEISKLRRMIWLNTYVNDSLGITKNKIIKNFRDFDEEVKNTKNMYITSKMSLIFLLF